MDEMDVSILQLLQNDARTPLSEVSSKVNLSLPAVSERLRKMERSKMIKQYSAILDPEKFEKKLCCYCFIILKNKNPQNDKKFHDFINGHPDIMECHCITGEYEYILKIVTGSPKELEALLVKLRYESPVVRTSTFIVLSTAKEQVSISPCIVKKK